MKKKIALFVLPALLVTTSCNFSLDKLMFWKNWGKKDEPAEKEEEKKNEEDLTVEAIVAAFEKMSKLESYTAVTEVSFEGEDRTYLNGNYVLSHDKTKMNYLIEQVGKNSKAVMSYQTTSVVKFSDAVEAFDCTKEEVINDFVLYRNQVLQARAGYQVSLDFSKEEITVVSPEMTQETYVVFDEAVGQTYDYSEGDRSYYNITDDGMGIVNADDVEEVIKNNATINGDTVVAEVDGQQISIKVKLSDGYVSSLEATLDGGVGMKITYSKFNQTSFEMPAQALEKPQCRWAHDSHSPYRYVKTETGHRKYCSECYRFLDEEKPHDHSHNSYGVCEHCGYIEGSKGENSTFPGFEKGESEYYLRGEKVANTFVETYMNYSYDWNAYDYSSSSYVLDFYVYSDNAVLVQTAYPNTPVEGACLTSRQLKYDLYKDLSASELATIKALGYGDERTLALKQYLATQTKSATIAGMHTERVHAYDSQVTEEFVLDECHTISCTTCQDCGEYNVSINTNHQQPMVQTSQVIDSCHTLIHYECPTCHESYEYTETNHVDGDPIIEEEKLDSCWTLMTGYCATCGECIGCEAVANHTGSTTTKVIEVDSCETRTLTICDSCHAIISDESEFHHEHVEHICCDYAALETYEFVENMGWHSEDSMYEFDYCKDCHKPVNGIVYEYENFDMNHPYYSQSYKIHHITEELSFYDYEYDTFDHELDENGICKYCHSKVVEMGEEAIGFVAKYATNYDGWYDFFFYVKATGEKIWYSEFDYSPEINSDEVGEYYEYTNDSYPGVALRLYNNGDGIFRLDIFYNNLTERVAILPSDFAH